MYSRKSSEEHSIRYTTVRTYTVPYSTDTYFSKLALTCTGLSLVFGLIRLWFEFFREESGRK